MTYVIYGILPDGTLSQGITCDYSGTMQDEIREDLRAQGATEIYRFWVGEEFPSSVEEARSGSCMY